MTDGDRDYHPRHLADEVDAGAGPADRIRQFLARHGWRGYALPALTVLAIVALVLAVSSSPAPEAVVPASAERSGTAPAPSATAPASDPSSPVAPSGGPAGPTEGYAQTGDGSLGVVPGQSGVLGSGGPLTSFDVEIEGGIGVDGAQFAADVERILGDPRSWGAGGQLSFQRVSDGTADLHVALVSPDHVEGLCPGYGTNGYTSCRYDDRVVINLARWSLGVDDYAGHLEEYRQYVINHEVGHFLGHGHVGCPGAGRKAPVMMQQTLDVGVCSINAWPYPNGPADSPSAPA